MWRRILSHIRAQGRKDALGLQTLSRVHDGGIGGVWVAWQGSPCTEKGLWIGGGTVPASVAGRGARLTLGIELSKETRLLTKQESLLGRDAWVESRRIGGLRRTTLLTVSGFTVMG